LTGDGFLNILQPLCNGFDSHRDSRVKAERWWRPVGHERRRGAPELRSFHLGTFAGAGDCAFSRIL